MALLLVGVTVHAAPQRWRSLYVEHGIEMFTADDAPLPMFKAEGDISAHLLDLLAVISDIPRRSEWLNGIQESRVIEGDVESRVVIYERFDLPWPLSDRDAVVESKISLDYDHAVVRVTYRQIEHPLVPTVEGYVRVPVVQGTMEYRFVDAERTSARYEVMLDVGGALPRWMVKLAVKKVPLTTLEAATRQARLMRGHYADFVSKQRQRLNIDY